MRNSCAPCVRLGGDVWSPPSELWTSCWTVALTHHFHHCPGDSCVRWMHYSEATKARESWARCLLDEFKSNVEMLKCAARDQQGPAPAHSSPQHGTHISCVTLTVVRCLLCYFVVSLCLSVFSSPPVYVRDDVYGPLGSQDRSGGEGGERGVGLRETDEGFLEWSTFTGPPVQCCWCLEPGTAVCTSVLAHCLVRWYTPWVRPCWISWKNQTLGFFFSLLPSLQCALCFSSFCR